MITWIIILITAGMSWACFKDYSKLHLLKFNAYDVWHKRLWYKLFSHGLVHGSWGHLIFNMLTLYFFGRTVEQYFSLAFGNATGAILFIGLYVTALAVSSIADLHKYRDNYNYSAVGASGAVSAVLFAAIFFAPKMGIYIYFIPIPIPGYIFGPLYLIYCQYMAHRNMDNIGHSAHFWGAIYGFIFPLILQPTLIDHFLSSF